MSSASELLSERLMEVEIKLAFIDDTLNQLLDADAAKSQQIVALERVIRQLRNELETVRSAHGGDAHSEPPPPHY
ncbi:SlyX family protein [Frateuria aurantia]